MYHLIFLIIMQYIELWMNSMFTEIIKFFT